MSIICQARPLTRRFIVELEQNADFPDQHFSIKHDWHTLSDSPSDIVDKQGCAEHGLPSHKKRHKSYSCAVKTTFIESISWQWLYTTNLLIAYELILTIKNNSPHPNPYSWLPLEAVITVSWLLKSYWNPNSPLFNLIEQKKAMQEHPFAITTMMAGSEHDPQQTTPSESSGQSVPQAITFPKGYFTQLLYSDSADGNENPQQHSHTLGLNCFLHPCNDVCQFRQSSDSSPGEVLDCEKSSADHTGATPEQGSCSHLASTHCYRCNSKDGLASVSEDTGEAHTTDTAGQTTCNVIVPGKNGQQRPCGKVCKNARALSVHKRKIHSGQQTCNETVAGKDGQLRPCGKVYKCAKALSGHKAKYHTGQKTCVVIVVREDGQKHPCGKIYKCAQALSDHKAKYHTGQKTCVLTVVREDGQPRPCGRVCKNSQALMDHKRKVHTGQQTCDVTVVTEHGQQRPCGKVCKNAQSLSSHKSKVHSGQQTCDLIEVGKDGEQQACGKVFKNTNSLSTHKTIYHTGQKTCSMTVIGEDGQQRPCRKVCKNAIDLSNHKRTHRKRRPVDVN
ncbi:hypothetical protein [Endozoicomonas sp. 8E]|uniref:hypothetical protein n=1 Tax=Endozoicomonas sp. 8E TaxID=3035692 RepID=UPI0029393E0D|nr:hypothetical protein [Endozoicomonas sp. 8E]WOG26944.1 hypothetical protein P6910_20700 [Endozoicomonas sp. 8E]